MATVTARCLRSCYAGQLYDKDKTYEIDDSAPHAKFFELPVKDVKDVKAKGKKGEVPKADNSFLE
jgi:hypothetical protein